MKHREERLRRMRAKRKERTVEEVERMASYQREWRLRNEERIKERRRREYEKDPEKVKEGRRKRYYRHRESMASAFDALYPPSTSGVGQSATAPVPPPPSQTPITRLGAVGVGMRPSVTSRTVSAGKQPRHRFAGKRLPGVRNPHRRGGATYRRRRRSLLSSSAGGSSGGGGGGSSDDDDGHSDASSTSSTNPGGRHRMSQEELRRQLEFLSNDQVQTASGRRIAGITTTNTITTTYKDGGRPRVARHSSRVSH